MAEPQWRTITYQGRQIRYAVLRRGGRRIVLIKRGKGHRGQAE